MAKEQSSPRVALPDAAPIFLIGFMGTGKSTVGRLLAGEVGFTFVDLDDVIIRQAGQTVAQIFASEGEPGFRAREEAAVRSVAAMRGTVIATGGGAACRESNLAAMLAAGQVVALSATPAEVIRRTGTGRAGRCCTARPIPKASLRRCSPSASRSTRAPTTASTPWAARPPKSHARSSSGSSEPAEVPRDLGWRRARRAPLRRPHRDI